ncbi:MAG: sulfatase-like hydrolase/transferase [Clostridiales bacterium]|nr:sulfatase-like hydrolase/transferase [Clostridiales bacterium]
MIKFKKKTISFTRNKWRWAIVVIITLALLFTVVLDTSMFDSRKTVSYLGKNSRSIGVLNGDAPFVQPFTPEKSHVDFIEIRFSTNREQGNILEPQGYLLFQLLTPEKDVLKEHRVQIKDMKDGFERFWIDMDLDIETLYRINLQVIDTVGEEVPTVWVAGNVKDALRSVTYPGYDDSLHLQSNAQICYSQMDYLGMIISILLLLLCSATALVNVNLSEKDNEKLTLAVMFLMPVLMFVIVELLNNNSVLRKTFPIYLINYVFYLLLYVLLFVGFNRFHITTIIANTVIMTLAVFNYFKLLWRGEPIQILDVVTLQTAMNVSDSYKIELSPILIISFLLFILSILIVLKCQYRFVLKRTRLSLGAFGLGLLAIFITSLFDMERYQVTAFSIMHRIGVQNNEWNQPSNYTNNGMLIALTMNAQHITVQIPEEYGEEKIDEIKQHIEQNQEYTMLPNEVVEKYEYEKTIREEGTERELQEGVKPHIIAIMNESYTDLSSVGEFETNLPMHPYMDSMFKGKNILHGDLSVSTYGGGTANSEFEFLTGNSMTFFPKGSIPYQQYITADTGSLPRYLKSLGYDAYAVHPFLASGWNRPEVYKYMGFDEFYSIDDFDDNVELFRTYISDKSSYQKLIELYENREEGKPLFLFNVTMQNHGSYKSTDPNFNQDVKLLEYPDMFPETEQYLTLARQSDIAVEYLIEYFKNVDEPVVICFFGDHLPSMINGFYEKLLGREAVDFTSRDMQKLYTTDFFIWANYDIPEYEVESISLNYLSTLLLQTAGIELPEYNLLIAEAYENYPILSTMGVLDAKGNRYNTLSEVVWMDEAKILKDYNIMAYNNVFGEGGRRPELFDQVSYRPALTEFDEYERKRRQESEGK